jgi:ribose 5-phosphate isomerase A
VNEKQIVGEKAVEFVKDGMVVGLGTGSTVFYTICKLGERVKQGLSIRGCPTSVQTEKLAKEWGIPLAKFAEIEQIDVAIDGADEVDSQLNLIKGGGGALLREKIIARAAQTFIVVADPSKMFSELGQMRLPVEAVPFGFELTEKHIERLGCEPHLRQSHGVPYMTDNGNYIFDCAFSGIPHAEELERNLNMIPGVVGNGLFVKMANMVITLDAKKNVIMKQQGSI